MRIFYNDNEAFCCDLLERRIADGSLPRGDVMRGDVRNIKEEALRGYDQIHLFAGIGGFPLGLMWAGWPDWLSIVTGGPPCQPTSVAGAQAGEADPRYLWPEMARLVAARGPDFVLYENPTGMERLALDRVCVDLEGAGYEVWTPLVLPACAVNSPQRRDRILIVAHRAGSECVWAGPGPALDRQAEPADRGGGGAVGDGQRDRKHQPVRGLGKERRRAAHAGGDGLLADHEHEPAGAQPAQQQQAGPPQPRGSSESLAMASGAGQGRQPPRRAGRSIPGSGAELRPTGLRQDGALGDGGGQGLSLSEQRGEPGAAQSWEPAWAATAEPSRGHWAEFEWIPCRERDGIVWRRIGPGLRLLAHGIPGRVARIKALGNAVVPQLVELWARAILDTVRRCAP